MKETSEIIHLNIDNLTSLWKTVAIPFGAYTEGAEFDYCLAITQGDWPNRLWFHKEISNENIGLAKDKIGTSQRIVPYWYTQDDDRSQLFEQNGFTVKFKQVGMCLKLETPFEVEQKITLSPVHNTKEAQLWAALYPKAFGYKISPDILMNTQEDIQYYLAYYQKQPIGTMIVYQTGAITGIHGVGVVPEMRNKGIASQIMKLLINQAIEKESDYMALQASDMGKNVYLRLGFEEQFVINNYIL